MSLAACLHMPVISWMMLGVFQKRWGKQVSNWEKWLVPVRTWNIFSRKTSEREDGWQSSLHWAEDNSKKSLNRKKITRYQEARVSKLEWGLDEAWGEGRASSLGCDKLPLSSSRCWVVRAGSSLTMQIHHAYSYISFTSLWSPCLSL